MGYGFRSDDKNHAFDIGLNYNDTGVTGTPSLPMDIIYSRGYVPTVSYESTIADIYSSAGACGRIRGEIKKTLRWYKSRPDVRMLTV